MKIAVLGNGAWGTALAQLLIDNKYQAQLWGIEQEVNDDINNNHRNSKYIDESVVLPTSLKSTMDLKEVLSDAKIVILAVPTKAVRSICRQMLPLLKEKVYIVSVSKGFDPETNERMSEVIRAEIPSSLRHEVVSLIGPSHAEEVVLRMLTLVTATSLSLEDAEYIQKVFSNQYFRVYTNLDEVGSEYSAAIKNVIAIASGVLEGLKYGDNARAALVTRGLTEMVRLGMAKGGKFETYMGLTGLGDLMVTCNSTHSRNFMAGYEIGLKNDAKYFMTHNEKTVEGVRSAKTIHEFAKELNVDMPICNAVYDVLYNDVKPSDALVRLMSRELKREQ